MHAVRGQIESQPYIRGNELDNHTVLVLEVDGALEFQVANALGMAGHRPLPLTNLPIPLRKPKQHSGVRCRCHLDDRSCGQHASAGS